MLQDLPLTLDFCSTPPPPFEKRKKINKRKNLTNHPQCTIHENSLLVQEMESWGRVVTAPAAVLPLSNAERLAQLSPLWSKHGGRRQWGISAGLGTRKN